MQDVDLQMRALDEFVTRARSQNEDHYTQFVSNLSGLASTVRDSYTHLGSEVAALQQDTTSFGADVTTQTDALRATLEPLSTATSTPLADLRQSIDAVPLKEYTPTGATPRKREYDYPRALPRTLPHEEIIAQMADGRPIRHQRKNSRMPLGEKDVYPPNKTASELSDTKGDLGADSLPAPHVFAHKIFSGTNIGGVVGPGGQLVTPGKFASDAKVEVEGEGDEDEEEDGQPPLKRTRSQSAKLGVSKGGYSNPLPKSSTVGDNVVIGKKRGR